MKNKLEFLLTEANIGTYNKCEIIEIFGFNREKKEAFNIYTLVVFENTKQIDIKELMTNKPQFFKGYKHLSWGIKRRVVTIEVVKKLYLELLENNKYKIDEPLSIGNFQLLQEQYVPLSEDIFYEVQINNILKNNFKNGSYILEFFDEEKSNVQFLLDNPPLLNSFSENISSLLPIKIGTLSDRLGNIIFQFPINSFELSHDSIRKGEPPKYAGISLEIYPKNNFDITNLQVRLYEDNDNLITRQRFINIENSVTDIDFDDCFGTNIEIINKKNSLLLYKYKFSIMKKGYINGNMVEAQKRVFKINEKVIKIEIKSNLINNIYGKSKNKAFDEWIGDRKYKEELKELEKSKAFVQYFGNEEEKALSDVRKLINLYGEKGVYLWDPYLSAKDIKNTLYFCETTYVPLRAISGFANKDKRHEREVFKEEMIEEFTKDNKPFLFLDLEVRGKIGIDGYKFHDRFLIFPLEKSKVWSLGISVNQLGGSHHILQEIKNAQHILNAFNKLWDELSHEECLIWKSK